LTEALIGWLSTKINSNKPEIRLQALRKSRDHFLRFLKITRSYEFHQYHLEKFEPQNVDDLANQTSSSGNKQADFEKCLINSAYDRNEKIRRYKELKEIESQIEKMQKALQAPHLDEEQRRKIFTTYIKYWINKSLDELKIAEGKHFIYSRIFLIENSSI
jgi:hypothetical protein